MAEVTSTALAANASTNTSQSSPTGNGKKGFLSLPGEVRNKIHRLLLCHDEVIDGHCGYDLAGQLLSTCRQVNLEGRSILYGENTFEIKLSNTKGPGWDADSHGRLSWEEPLSLVRRMSFHIRYTYCHEIADLRDTLRMMTESLGREVQRGKYLDFLQLDCHLDCDNENDYINWRDPCWDHYDPSGTEYECATLIRGRFAAALCGAVKEVEVTGMSKEDEDFIKETLQWRENQAEEHVGDDEESAAAIRPPSASLLARYEVIEELHLEDFKLLKSKMRKALVAAEGGQVDKFNRLEEKMLSRVRKWYQKLESAFPKMGLEQDTEKERSDTKRKRMDEN
ncbi:hypothetical protein V8F33_005789 [Rhypophila sp. PSN 637]